MDDKYPSPLFQAFFFLFFLFTLILGISCKNIHLEKYPVQDLKGNWELRGETGGIAGYVQYPAGNGAVYQFYTNGTYIRHFNATEYHSGTFTINTQKSIRTQKMEKFIAFDPISAKVSLPTYYSVRGDTLDISFDFAGQPLGSWYLRIP